MNFQILGKELTRRSSIFRHQYTSTWYIRYFHYIIKKLFLFLLVFYLTIVHFFLHISGFGIHCIHYYYINLLPLNMITIIFTYDLHVSSFSTSILLITKLLAFSVAVRNLLKSLHYCVIFSTLLSCFVSTWECCFCKKGLNVMFINIIIN